MGRIALRRRSGGLTGVVREKKRDGNVVFKSHYSYNAVQIAISHLLQLIFHVIIPSKSLLLGFSALNFFYFFVSFYRIFFLLLSCLTEILVFLLPLCFTQLPFSIFPLPLFFIQFPSCFFYFRYPCLPSLVFSYTAVHSTSQGHHTAAALLED